MPTSKGMSPRDSKSIKRKHAPGTLCSFPQEILDTIFSYLPTTEIKHLRLVAKAFHPAANAVLFRDNKFVLPDDIMEVIGMGESAAIAKYVKSLTLLETAILPSLPPLEECMPMIKEMSKEGSILSTDRLRASHKEISDYLQQKREARQIRLSPVWKDRIYEAGNPNARFCDDCRVKSTGMAGEALERNRQTLKRLENALLSMANLTSVAINPMCYGRVLDGHGFYVPAPLWKCIDNHSGQFTTSVSEQQHLIDINRNLVYFILRFFGWRNTLGGEPLRTVDISFNCRGENGLNVLERIGWRDHHGGESFSGEYACCFHGDQQYSLFLDSISHAAVVEMCIETEADKSATEALFLVGPGQDLLLKATRARELFLELDTSEEVFRPDLGGWNTPVTHPAMDSFLGLGLSFPKWKSLRRLELMNVHVFFGALRDMLTSLVPELEELALFDVVLNRYQHEQGADWWTIFNLIRELNSDRNIYYIGLDNLKVNAGYIQKASGTSGATPTFDRRIIPDDAYDLEVLCYDDDDDIYWSEYRRPIQYFVGGYTDQDDEVPQGWDDLDYLYAQVAEHGFRGEEDEEKLPFHAYLARFLRDDPRADARCKAQGWDRNKIIVDHPDYDFDY
ncbi:hypothetical protein HDK90DRAFT_509198 [Phyllosticta capitalensis]|uniref:F-box domain-containing protein n=1 Tax=Phyllosticta capitalensis TaxID=121624 RepID=A0ABR1YX60_9PEZI